MLNAASWIYWDKQIILLRTNLPYLLHETQEQPSILFPQESRPEPLARSSCNPSAVPWPGGRGKPSAAFSPLLPHPRALFDPLRRWQGTPAHRRLNPLPNEPLRSLLQLFQLLKALISAISPPIFISQLPTLTASFHPFLPLSTTDPGTHITEFQSRQGISLHH